MTDSTTRIGIIGLGVMGLSLARNMTSKGLSVVGYDANIEMRKAAESQGLETVDTLAACVSSLESPRRIMMMVPAGDPVDGVLRDVSPLLDEGDSVVDGGNSHFKATARREQELAGKGIHYLGLGVSGGRRGALEGPGMMAGGSKEAYSLWKDMLEAVAARYQDEPCVTYLGHGGAGHYVKMVHNGIEYAMMQVLAEAYAILNKNSSLTHHEIGKLFREWNRGELGAYLTGITADIFSRKDAAGRYWIDEIKDIAKHKGTGTWTVQNSLELGVPVPGIDAAVRQRQISAHAVTREQFNKQLEHNNSDTDQISEHIENSIGKAVYAAQLLNYVQGFHLLASAKEAYGFSYSLQGVAGIWRNGCIISSEIVTLLSRIDLDAYIHPLMAPALTEAISRHIQELRSVVSASAMRRVSVPAMSANLSYWNSFSDIDLPTNLIQAQRDYFGGHGLELRSGEKTSLDWERTTNRKPDSD